MKKLKAIIALLAFIAGAVPVIVDTFGAGNGIQYAYNAAFFLIIAPACIELSGILEWGHPEYFRK